MDPDQAAYEVPSEDDLKNIDGLLAEVTGGQPLHFNIGDMVFHNDHGHDDEYDLAEVPAVLEGQSDVALDIYDVKTPLLSEKAGKISRPVPSNKNRRRGATPREPVPPHDPPIHDLEGYWIKRQNFVGKKSFGVFICFHCRDNR